MSAATSPNCKAKARVNLFLIGCECSGYVNSLTGTDLVNKISGREFSLVLFQPTCPIFFILKLFWYIASKENDNKLEFQSIYPSWLVL